MISRFNSEQRKLIYSLGANFMTRVPGAVGVLWFLPLLRFGLGTADYASLLASMSLSAGRTDSAHGRGDRVAPALRVGQHGGQVEALDIGGDRLG